MINFYSVENELQKMRVSRRSRRQAGGWAGEMAERAAGGFPFSCDQARIAEAACLLRPTTSSCSYH